MTTNDHINGLNDLHDLLVDSRKGYREASERAEDPAIKEMLNRFSNGRITLIDELVAGRQRVDATYKPSDGTIKGDLHRVWMDVRDALSSNENANVLRECERGENYLLERYSEVLEKEGLPADLRALLMMQQAEIRANVEAVRAMRRMKETVE
jgi:uncharacterized protein (TIGR02284 family)